MKNYTGAICYNQKPFNALVKMIKALKTKQVNFEESTIFQMPLKDIVQNGKPIGILYNEVTDEVFQAKIRVSLEDNYYVDYKIHSVGGVLYASGGNMTR